MSNRFYSILSLILAAALGAVLFITSESVQHNEKQLASLQEKLAVERDSMRVLNAEWTYLNRPDRLEQLAQTYLQLNPAGPTQVLDTPAEIPEPLAPIRPGMKPAIVPASFHAPVGTNINPAVAIPVATAPATQQSPKKLPPPATNPSFNQLIGRIANSHDTP